MHVILQWCAGAPHEWDTDLKLSTFTFSLCRFFVLLAYMFALPTYALEAPSSSISFEAADYTQVDVDRMIKLRSKPGDKQRYFIEPTPVKFLATLMQKPKAGEYQIVYDSLNAWGVSPLPDVEHSSYLKVEGGKVIPVYLEKQAAEFINAHMAEQQQAEFYALHIYNYEKGPRFLVVSVQGLTGREE